MRKTYSVLLCLLLLLLQARYIFPQDREWDQSESRGLRDTVIPGLFATGETLACNILPMLWNGLVYKSEWAFPTGRSIRNNFKYYWQWEDTDDFQVNQISHPYHGSLYFNSGRVNGFGFYGSLLFSTLGAFTWETLFEENQAAFNDFITTTTGSMVTGEILYRLYVEARAAGVPLPLALLINPVAGIHSLITGWKPPAAGSNLYQFQVYLGAGYAKTNYSVSDGEREIFSFRGPFADIGARIVYGNPFEQDTWVPFRHFEIAGSVGMNPGRYVDLRVISDAYLFSFSPVYTNEDTMSTGLSLHLDFHSQGEFSFEDSSINHSSHALDWTIKYQHMFSENTGLQLKLHTGVTFLGASKYFANTTVVNLFGNVKKDYNNFGGGLNSKLYSVLNYKWGRLQASVFCYVLWTYPGASHFSQGRVYSVFTDLSYSHFITKRLSLGLNHSYSMERGVFSGRFPDTHKTNEAVKLFAAWNL